MFKMMNSAGIFHRGTASMPRQAIPPQFDFRGAAKGLLAGGGSDAGGLDVADAPRVSGEFCIIIDEFCITNDGFVLQMMNFPEFQISYRHAASPSPYRRTFHQQCINAYQHVNVNNVSMHISMSIENMLCEPPPDDGVGRRWLQRTEPSERPFVLYSLCVAN